MKIEMTPNGTFVICVKLIDMLDGTPVLDIKPHVEENHDCPSYPQYLISY